MRTRVWWGVIAAIPSFEKHFFPNHVNFKVVFPVIIEVLLLSADRSLMGEGFLHNRSCLGRSSLSSIILKPFKLRVFGKMVSIVAVLTTYRTRMVCSKRWPFALLLGIAQVLVLILVGVASSLGSWWALLVVYPLSRVPFWLVFLLFLHHVRRVVLLVVLVWLVLGRLHKVNLCIGLHRRVLCWGLSITRSLVCT